MSRRAASTLTSINRWALGAAAAVFKTNVKTFVSLRKAEPPIPLAYLQALATHFPDAGYDFPLDPSYEPERSEEQRQDPTIPPPDPRIRRCLLCCSGS